MARVTVQDCENKAETRFALVVLCAERAHNIRSGAPITIERNNDKDPVVALREIALGHVTAESLEETLIAKSQKFNKVDTPEATVTMTEDLEKEHEFEYLADSNEFYINEDEDLSFDQDVELSDEGDHFAND